MTRTRILLSVLEDLQEERRRLDEEINHRRKAEARFRATVEAAPIAMIMADAAGQITLANTEAERLFGYAKGELPGQVLEVLLPRRFRQAHPGMREGFLACPEARSMGAGRELFARRKDGAEFPVEIGLNPVETDEGLFVLSTIVDITERRRLEEAQRKLNEELERRVDERTAELARANEALARSNVDLQQFAYVASHDLQTPLRAISGFAEMLQRRYSGALDEKADDYIGRIVGGAGRMKKLIEALLAYSRVDSHSNPLAPTALGDALGDALSLLANAIKEEGAEVERGPLPTVDGDREQLVQLLHNLIGNAIKYRGESPPRIRVEAARENGHWVVAVADNGIGIEPEHRRRVFEIFRRLHPHDRYPGTGIGLAVCRRVVLRHGGCIWVDDGDDGGCRFCFTLPFQGGEDGAAEDVPGEAGGQAGGTCPHHGG